MSIVAGALHAEIDVDDVRGRWATHSEFSEAQRCMPGVRILQKALWDDKLLLQPRPRRLAPGEQLWLPVKLAGHAPS